MNVVIVGASSGIGLHLTERLYTKHTVFPFSRSTGYDFTRFGKGLEAAMEVSPSPVDALIVTAGHQAALGRIEDCEPTAWNGAIVANLGVALHAINAFYPLLRKARRPKIVCLSGGGATQGRPYFSSYACAKTAVVRLVETLAMEEPYWDCNCVAPGAMNTRMLDSLLEAPVDLIGPEERLKSEKQRDSGGDSMNDALDLIEFLISPESNGISGKLISAKWDNWKDTALRGRLWDKNSFLLRRTT